MKKQKQLKQQKKGKGDGAKYAWMHHLKIFLLLPLLQTESISGLCPGYWESLTELEVLMKYFPDSWAVIQKFERNLCTVS